MLRVCEAKSHHQKKERRNKPESSESRRSKDHRTMQQQLTARPTDRLNTRDERYLDGTCYTTGSVQCKIYQIMKNEL